MPFHWSLWLCGKNDLSLPGLQSVIAQITNPINIAKGLFFFLSFCGCRRCDSGLFTAAVLWNRLRLYTKLLYHPNNPFLTKHKRILLFFCFSFASVPLPLFFFLFCFVLLCLNCFQEQDNNGGEGWGGGRGAKEWHCTAEKAQENICCGIFREKKRGWREGPIGCVLS